MIVIVDYGMGNLRSITKAMEHCGARVEVTRNAEKIKESQALVLPGVGAFKDAIKELSPLANIIKKYDKPLLGICLGMQLFFTESEEGGLFKGLDLIKGRVVRLPDEVKIPHMGWNDIEIKGKSRLLKGIKSGEYFYFVHSYFVVPENNETIKATTNYGVEIPAVIEKENIFATQFHPEKSGEAGLRILRNFVEMVKP
ncbi:MAG: imidazole glycerol phosphate synthase subunit HisH [Candidatus Hydrothermarchaeota archaeon]|nr:MAG: imidazole glycerol phosphate synthase subunit HisH [Candidatus Hydrothermarchaeota archaeon]